MTTFYIFSIVLHAIAAARAVQIVIHSDRTARIFAILSIVTSIMFVIAQIDRVQGGGKVINQRADIVRLVFDRANAMSHVAFATFLLNQEKRAGKIK